MDCGHVLVARASAGLVQSTERRGPKWPTPADHAPGGGSGGDEGQGLSRLQLGCPAHQSPVELRLLRGQSPRHELRRFQLFLVSAGDPKVFAGWATEVDVFELCGKSAAHDRRYYMTLHVSATPVKKRHWQVGSYWESPWRVV